MDYYGTLDGAQTYHELRGNSDWLSNEKTDGQRTSALVRASSALDGIYGPQFGGRKAGGRTQLLAWPRNGAYDHCADELIPADEIPHGILSATYELALSELASPGSSAPIVTLGRMTKREKVDVIEREFFGSDSGLSVDAMRPVLTAVEDALRCLLTDVNSESGGGSVFLLRY